MNLKNIITLQLLLFNLSHNSIASYRPADHMLTGTKDISKPESLTILGVGTALTLSALFFDHSIRDRYHDQHTDDNVYKLGNKFFGHGYFGMILGGASLGYGLAFDDSLHTNAGTSHLEGLAATGIYTFVLKYAVARPRPPGGAKQSFPSGHTSTIFATATSVTDFYGWTWGIPMYAIAAYTGFGRIYSDAHYLSDVLFGATLGTVVAHAYSFHHKQNSDDAQKAEVKVVPYFDTRENFGAILSLNY